jgi:electron transfer flavoprotein beta subunit
VQNGKIVARRESSWGVEVYEVEMPAIVAVKEGLNLPRHPSLRGTMSARKKPLERSKPVPAPMGLELIRLKLAPDKGSGGAEILGTGSQAIPRIVKVLEEVGVL